MGNTNAKLAIVNAVTNVGLNTWLCRSQTYDGAGNMSGKQNGASNQFCEIIENKKAVYFNCASMNSICAHQKHQRFQRYTTW